jgi:hypothetical protein
MHAPIFDSSGRECHLALSPKRNSALREDAGFSDEPALISSTPGVVVLGRQAQVPAHRILEAGGSSSCDGHAGWGGTIKCGNGALGAEWSSNLPADNGVIFFVAVGIYSAPAVRSDGQAQRRAGMTIKQERGRNWCVSGFTCCPPCGRM